jgi:hypothetical protein
VLTVSRENLLNGTLSSLVSADDMELKKPLRVSWIKTSRRAMCYGMGACMICTLCAMVYMCRYVCHVLRYRLPGM